MNFWQFASGSPWLTFFLACVVFSCISRCVIYSVVAISNAIAGKQTVIVKKDDDTEELSDD